MDKVLVGLQGPSAALGWAADLAGRAGAGLAIASVFSPGQSELPPDEYAALRSAQADALGAWAATQPEAESVLLEGPLGSALLAGAASQEAGLVVVPADDEPRTADGGNRVHHLVRHTTVPLAVVPEDAAEPIAHLVVGVDGSDTSRAAVAAVAALAGPLGVGVTAVLAFEPVLHIGPKDGAGGWLTHAQEQLAEWTEPIAATGADLELKVDESRHPVEVLQAELDAHPGSTVVVGARGVGGFSGLRLGRVPMQLLDHTDRPLILVPAATS